MKIKYTHTHTHTHTRARARAYMKANILTLYVYNMYIIIYNNYL